MKLDRLTTLFAGVMAVTFLLFTLLPVFSLTRFGATPDPQSVKLLQLAGALFGGMAVLSWVMRETVATQNFAATANGLAAVNALATLVSLSAALSGSFNGFSWVPFATFALFTIAFQAARIRETRHQES